MDLSKAANVYLYVSGKWSTGNIRIMKGNQKIILSRMESELLLKALKTMESELQERDKFMNGTE